MTYYPGVDSRRHPVYRKRQAHWATVYDAQGRAVEGKGPYLVKEEARAEAEIMAATRSRKES